jgi:ankyrin repeat protein
MLLQNGWTALMEASRYGHKDIVQQLLAAPGINIKAATTVNVLNKHWCSPLADAWELLG